MVFHKGEGGDVNVLLNLTFSNLWQEWESVLKVK